MNDSWNALLKQKLMLIILEDDDCQALDSEP